MILLALLSLFALQASAQLQCAAGNKCFPDPTTPNLVWVMLESGNVNGPTCSNVCLNALKQNTAFYACDSTRPTPTTLDAFSTVAQGLGVQCVKGGCWDGVSGDGQIWVSINTAANGTKRCYLPSAGTLSCKTHPGNANCFGERYSLVCPCVVKPLEEACVWDSPPQNAKVATFPTTDTGTSCLERINYWRKRACAEGWVECPPSGLPPMVECVDCHECTNAQAEFDSKNGAHASFKRCGDFVQGEGGGATCADVIDSFVSERKADENGVVRCQGHCGPIVAHGCQTFHWGKAQSSNFHTLNWRSCNTTTCKNYCANPSSNDCFRVDTSPPSSPPPPPPPTTTPPPPPPPTTTPPPPPPPTTTPPPPPPPTTPPPPPPTTPPPPPPTTPPPPPPTTPPPPPPTTPPPPPPTTPPPPPPTTPPPPSPTTPPPPPPTTPPPPPPGTTPPTMTPPPPPPPLGARRACRVSCKTTLKSCREEASAKKDRKKCAKKFKKCRKPCKNLSNN